MPNMRVIVISEYGGPEVLREQRREIPRANADSVVVRVHAFASESRGGLLSQRASGATLPR